MGSIRGGIDWEKFARNTALDATDAFLLHFVLFATLQLLLAAVGARHGYSSHVFVGRVRFRG